MNLSARITTVAIVLGTLSVAQVSRAEVEPDDVLKLAVESGDWLLAQGQAQDRGMAWPGDARKADSTAYDLGTGTAGVVVYLLALHAASGDERFLQAAEQGGDHLATLLNDTETIGTGARRASLYTGVAGVGVALALLAEQRPAFAEAAGRAVALLRDWQVPDPAGVYWSDEFNDLLYGDAGTILFLAWYGHRYDDAEALALAAAGSRFLAAQAETADAGRYWRFRRSKPFNLPGFTHGTAGIAYVLATVGALVDDADLKAAAADGLDYIDSIAIEEDGRVRIPYGWPAEYWEGLYDFGWAHGLAGSAAMFRQLAQMGVRTDAAASYYQRAVATLATIGLPGIPDTPFAEPSTALDWRFGRASVMAMLSDAGEGQASRDGIWQQIAATAIREDDAAHWLVNAPEFMGGGEAEFTGLLHGAAGIGLASLRVHSAMLERPPYIALPDDPAAWSR